LDGTSHTTCTALKASDLHIEPATKDLQVDIDTMPPLTLAPGSAVDVTDRWARLLGQVDIARANGAAMAAANPLITGTYDALGNRMPSMDVVGRAGYFQLTDGVRLAEIDTIEGAQVRIDLAHHMIHEGKGYTCDDYATGLGAGASKYWHFKAPNTATRIHINATIFATDAGVAYFYETPTTTADGTALTPRNNDRNNATASTLSVWKDPTVTADGTQLGVSALGTNNPKTRFGGEAKQNFEWILKQNTAYLLKFTAANAGTAVNLGLEYYEA
jgi:hypothetical protein